MVVALGVPVRDPHWKFPFFSVYHSHPSAARCGRSLAESQKTYRNLKLGILKKLRTLPGSIEFERNKQPNRKTNTKQQHKE